MPRSLDPNLKMNLPLRVRRRSALVAAARDGTISVIATDHAPHAAHEDVLFEQALPGVIGLEETAFARLYTHLVGPGPTLTPFERMSAGPARAYGPSRPGSSRGRRPSRPARPGTARRVGEGGFRVAPRNSWPLGETLRGRVRPTVAAGRSRLRA
jgi:dihydroorotase